MQRLFRPRTIATVGSAGWCGNIIRECDRIGFAGQIWPVHPTRSEIGGRPAFADIASLPEPPDAVFVGVNRNATIDVVAQLSRAGAGGAVCFAAGFLEAAAELQDGAQMQQRLLAAAGDMPLLGPNCYGFINALDGAALWPDQHGAVRVDRGVAIVTQSSNIAINLTMQRRGLPLGYIVTVGNQAQIGFSTVAMTLLNDPRVTALGLHIEGIDDLAALQQLAATSHRLGKRIVALKVGASEQARSASVSHTASIAGSDAAGRALLRRLGIAQVDSLSVFLETLKILHVAGPLTSNRIASMSCSGGEASLMADAALGAGVALPPLNRDQLGALRVALGPQVALANPLDYHTYIWGDQAALSRCFRAMADPSLALSCVVLDFPRADRCTTTEWDQVLDAFDASRMGSRAPDLPQALISSLPENMPEAVAERCCKLGIVPLCGIPDALHAISAAAGPWPAEIAAPVWPPGPEPADVVLLTEADAKAALVACGLRIPTAIRATTADAAAQAATRIGFPVVLKAEGMAHKTEVGAVVLGLADAMAVQAAAQRMNVASYLVEEMVDGTVAELLIGVTRDAPHGWLLTIGAGGTMAELLRDTVSLLLPVTPAQIRASLTELRLWPVLQGWRGASGADIEAIVAAVMAVQTFVANTSGLVEVEVNPLLCRQHDAVAVDALVRKGKL